MPNRTVISLTVAAALVICAPGAQAADSRNADAGFYGGLGLGRSATDLEAGSLGAVTDERDGAWKAFGGYQFNRIFAIEAGYYDLGRASAASTAGSATFDSTALQVSAVGTLPLTSQLGLLGKVGVARTDTDVIGTVGAPFSTSDKETNPSYGLGLRYDATKTFGLRGEWERFQIGGAGIAGKSDVDLFTISGIYRFE